MRCRASREMLAPGVNARDTAERETPARLATSAAVTKAPRIPCSLMACLLHTCASNPMPFCTRVQHYDLRERLGCPCEPAGLRAASRSWGDPQHPAENGNAPGARP